MPRTSQSWKHVAEWMALTGRPLVRCDDGTVCWMLGPEPCQPVRRVQAATVAAMLRRDMIEKRDDGSFVLKEEHRA